MLVLPNSSLRSRGFWERQPIRANIPKSTVFQLFFANHHKIPHNFKILTFDLKTAEKVQNRKKRIKKVVS
jgi:hypothetical protein